MYTCICGGLCRTYPRHILLFRYIWTCLCALLCIRELHADWICVLMYVRPCLVDIYVGVVCVPGGVVLFCVLNVYLCLGV